MRYPAIQLYQRYLDLISPLITVVKQINTFTTNANSTAKDFEYVAPAWSWQWHCLAPGGSTTSGLIFGLFTCLLHVIGDYIFVMSTVGFVLVPFHLQI
jgi:hypothetical protein